MVGFDLWYIIGWPQGLQSREATHTRMTEATLSPNLGQDAVARILDVAQKLAQPLDLLHMLSEVVDAGMSVLSADKASLWLFEPANGDLVMKVPDLKPPPHIAMGAGLVGLCLATREIINVTDAYRDPRFQRAVDMATGYKTQSVLNVPLLGWEKQPVGVLQLLNKSTGVFDEVDERVASTLAAQCAVAVQRAQLMEALLLLLMERKDLWQMNVIDH